MNMKKLQNKNEIYMFKYNGSVEHRNLKFSLILSFCLIFISFCILIFLKDNANIVELTEKCEIVNFWFAFARFILNNFDPAFISLFGICFSAVVMFMKGENKFFYLQLYTFDAATTGFSFPLHKLACRFNKKLYDYMDAKRNNCRFRQAFYKIFSWLLNFLYKWFNCGAYSLSLLFVISFIIETYAKENGRATGAALSAFAMIALIVSVIYYIIRYNNESSYLKEEQCFLIITKLKNRENFLEYLSLILPESQEQYNDIDGDISLLKLLLSRVSFSTDCSKADETVHVTVEENEVLTYYKQIIIPFVVRMLKTYSKTQMELILALQSNLSVDFSKSVYANKMLRYFLLVVSRQYLIEHFNPYEIEDEKLSKIEEWTTQTEKEFFSIYETYDFNKMQNFEINHGYFDIYFEFIEHLHMNNIINASDYAIKEIAYMEKHKILKLNGIISDEHSLEYNFSPTEVVFLNTMLYH